MVVVGVDDGNQGHAYDLAPAKSVLERGEQWTRSVLANWTRHVVPNVGVRRVESAAQEGRIYRLLTVPPSIRAPQAGQGGAEPVLVRRRPRKAVLNLEQSPKNPPA